MSFDKEIDPPYTLASLPRPLESTNGRTQAAGVCSLSGSRKRKRTEIVVGVDGEGILIYSLQNPQLVTSYALPPQTSFTAPPFSIYQKRHSKQPSCRFTYASISPSSPGESAQLVCFTEQVQKDKPAETTKTSYSIPKYSAGVVAIDSLPVSAGNISKSGAHDILVVFSNGHIASFSADLKSQRWKTDLDTLAPPSAEAKPKAIKSVDYVALSTARNVLRGLLRNREDIAAILDTAPDSKSEILDLTQILCTVSQREADNSNAEALATLDLYQLSPRSPDLITSHLLPAKHLVSWILPTPSPERSLSVKKPLYSLHSSTGVLHQLRSGVVLSYDLSGLVPRLTSKLEAPGHGTTSFVRILPDLILAASVDSCGVFDVKYNSLQALLTLDQPKSSPTSKKRKHIEAESTQGVQLAPSLISYFADLGLAVGIQGHELVGIQLASTLSRKKTKSNGALLIDSIGKGFQSVTQGGHVRGQSSKDSKEWQDWQRKIHKLDKYASKGKVAEFENLFARELEIEFMETGDVDDKDLQALVNGDPDQGLLTNGVEENEANGAHDTTKDKDLDDSANVELRKWKLPQVITDAHRQQQRQHAVYALSRIFRWEEPDRLIGKQANQPSLQIHFFPPNVFQWLLLSGHLTKESIRRSLLEHNSHSLRSIPSIHDGDLVKSIVAFDPELHILSAVLNHNHFLPVGEVVQAIGVLMQNLEDRPQTDESTKHLTNGTALSEDAMDVDVTSELEAATQDLDHALSILDNGLFVRSQTLRPALIRLHTFPGPVVASALRSMLPRRDLESLIQLLHSELKNGGWTSPYEFIDAGSSPIDPLSEEPDDHAIAIIASLLSCSLDAIGTGAWLTSVGGTASEDSVEEMVNNLHEETTLALNGFWEVKYMKGLLSEFLRYAANTAKGHKLTSKELQRQGKPFPEDLAMDGALPMLPLGGKADTVVEKTKPGKGGKKEERSAREIGMLISKRVPKYSFERIVI
ncbi:hypothetical protein BCR34DRAFT_136080 [Clohesyomyces aquaticus]|uniref:Utp8 beta-propeller domain-containing protein n=1 Tax=Clohesyomyces aquaticus TaxID=1231657 RepID=A0A1Y2AC73_9PLEO|nr:hypothetical protein BCR34DRAFT_136080 [Clohesyomyces aquaticus]